MDKRGAGSITLFSQKCFVSQCLKKSYRNLSVFHSSGYPKISGIRGVGHDLLSKNLCLTVPEKIVEGIFQCFTHPGIQKFEALEG